MDYSWKNFVQLLSKQEIEHKSLIPIQLSQAILESGRGNSFLFRNYGNPYGMKYRKEMSEIATPKEVSVSDGKDIYCWFKSEEIAVNAYWIFLNREIYKGWENYAEDSRIGFMRYIINRGYVGGDENAKLEYLSKIIKLLPEADHILEVI